MAQEDTFDNDAAFRANFDRESKEFHGGNPTPVPMGKIQFILFCQRCAEVVCQHITTRACILSYLLGSAFLSGGSRVPKGMEEHADWRSLPEVGTKDRKLMSFTRQQAVATSLI